MTSTSRRHCLLVAGARTMKALRSAGLACGIVVLAAPCADAQQPAASAPDRWWERITFSGDLRGRYEGFYQDGLPARHRERVRLRVSLAAKLTDEVVAGVRLASGVQNDVASTNQSLGDFLTRKAINIDQAFIAYSAKAVPGLTVGGGKYPFMVNRTQMTWDDDINWEGTYEQFERKLGTATVKLVAVQSPILQVTAAEDSFLFAHYGQAGWKVGSHSVSLAVGDYLFTSPDRIAVGLATGAVNSNNTNLLRRNTAGTVVGFASGFHLLDFIAQATLATRYRDYPVTLLVDRVTNLRSVTDEDTGWWIVGGVGSASRVGTGAITYTFANVEQDAVVSAFTFSDMPGTEIRAHMLGVSYMALPRLNVDVTGIFSRRLEVPAGTDNAVLTRLQVDARVRF
jgi:hypothetical protein